MAVTIATGVATSVTAGSKTAELVTGQNQFVGKGTIQLFIKASAAAATGIRASLSVGGVPLINDALVPFAGSAGTLSVNDNQMISQMVSGGYVSLTARNDSAGTLTFDYNLVFTPGK